MKARLKNYKQSPRKVRLIAKFIRGKSVSWARAHLRFLDQKSASVVLSLLNSALSNAGIDLTDTKAQDDLVIREIRVDEGMKLKRYRPRAFGRVAPFKRRYSHVSLELDKRDNK